MKNEPQKNLTFLIFGILLIVIVLTAVFFIMGDKEEQQKAPETNQFDKEVYIHRLLEERKKTNAELLDTTVSRFSEEERAHFAEKGLQYFDPDPAYRVKARFSVDTTTPVFPFPTNTERTPNYRIYGYFDFTIHDTLCKLTAYQNMDFKNSPDYDNTLFVPFMDNTNGVYTYGGGRYMDIPIPESDTVILDFNEAYNPYCAYSSQWSCPLVPFENDLNVIIPAGEKRYK